MWNKIIRTKQNKNKKNLIDTENKLLSTKEEEGWRRRMEKMRGNKRYQGCYKIKKSGGCKVQHR